jgi:hypothetical protein
MSVGFILALSSVLLVLIEAGLTYLDGMFLPSQMVMRYPIGFPFISNGGMWGDLFFVTPVLYIIGKYHEQWGVWLCPAIILGVAVSYAMHHFVYLKGTLPDSLAGGGRPISPAGWIHVAYFGIGFALITLFYFCSAAMNDDVIWVGILLALHIIVANHVPFYYIAKHYNFAWCTTIFDTEAAPLRILLVAISMLTTATLAKLFTTKLLTFLTALLS